MRDTYRVNGQESALKWLLWIMAGLFVTDRLLQSVFQSYFLSDNLNLSFSGLREGRIWQFVSYAFMHANFWHILCNGLILYFIGRYVEQKYGNRRLVAIFLATSIIGAVAWLALEPLHPNSVLLGASAGCLGIFSYFCLACEDRPLTFLLYFVLPVKLRPRSLLLIAAGLEALSFLTQELSGGTVASSAHLGGILGGYLCYVFYRYRNRCMNAVKEKLTYRSRSTEAMHGESYQLYITSYSAQEAEIDRILDKINETGFKSLTEEERETLNSTKHLMHS